MASTLTVCDETTGGAKTHEFTIDLLTERITIREVIRARVYQEVKDYNVQQSGLFRGLVQPSEAETSLNGFTLKKGRTIDWQRQFDAALAAFEKNQIVVLVDERQAEDLDEEIVVGTRTRVTFLKLVPLVGG